MEQTAQVIETTAAIAARAAEEAADLATPGHEFTHAWLADHLGYGNPPAQTEEFKKWEIRRITLVEAWKDALLHEYGIAVHNRRSHGYVVTPPEKLAQTRAKRFDKDIKNLFHRELDVLVNASVTNVSQEQRTARHNEISRINIIKTSHEHARPRPPRSALRALHEP